MDTRLKIASITSFASMIVVALTLAISPVGASGGGFSWMIPPPPPQDYFTATNTAISNVDKINNVTVNAGGEQEAYSGGVKVGGIDDLKGNVVTGNASNKGTSTATATATNSATAPTFNAPAVPSVDLTEFDNVTLTNMAQSTVKSTNNVTVNNGIAQTAATGSVDLHCMDDAMGVTTGNASNEATLTTTVTASN